MTPEQRQEIISLLEHGEELSPEWARVLFPPEKREYELVYHGKDARRTSWPTRWPCRSSPSARSGRMAAAIGRICSFSAITCR